MNTPPLAPAPVATAVASAVAAPPDELLVFEALADGQIAGRAVRRGDLIACRRDLPPAGAAVLMPRGKGRPVAGEVVQGALRGAWGEPCHPDRWVAAGPIVAGLRRLGRAWRVVEAWTDARQLGLFANVST